LLFELVHQARDKCGLLLGTQSFDFRKGELLLEEKKVQDILKPSVAFGRGLVAHGLTHNTSVEIRKTYTLLLVNSRRFPFSVWRARSDCGLKGWHVFRHSFISALASKGVDQRIIEDLVGTRQMSSGSLTATCSRT
jgi:hypothetical protein